MELSQQAMNSTSANKKHKRCGSTKKQHPHPPQLQLHSYSSSEEDLKSTPEYGSDSEKGKRKFLNLIFEIIRIVANTAISNKYNIEFNIFFQFFRMKMFIIYIVEYILHSTFFRNRWISHYSTIYSSYTYQINVVAPIQIWTSLLNRK